MVTATKGAFQGLRFITLFTALGFMAAQLAYTVRHLIDPNNVPHIYWAGIVAPALLLLFFLLPRKGGEIRIYAHRITGRRSLGGAFDFPLAEVGSVELNGKKLALKSLENDLLLVETLRNPEAGGLIWLCKQYGDATLGWDPTIWEAFSKAEGNGFPTATRLFVDENGLDAFGDNGFLVTAAGQTWYFPASTMFPAKVGSSIPARAHDPQTAAPAIIQIDPNPELIPLARFCKALTSVKLPDAIVHERLEELAENHGGNAVTPQDGDVLGGECLGYAVRVWKV